MTCRERQLDNAGHVRVNTPSLGRLKLRLAEKEDIEYLVALLAEDIDDHEMLVRALHHQLVKPKLGPDAIRDLSNEELRLVADAYLERDRLAFRGHEDADSLSFTANFRRSVGVLARDQASITSRLNIAGRTALGAGESTRSVRAWYEVLKGPIEEWVQWRGTAMYRDAFSTHINMTQTAYPPSVSVQRLLEATKWFLTRSTYRLGRELEKLANTQNTGKQAPNGAVDQFFVGHFKGEGTWEPLLEMVDGWADNRIFKPRMDLLKDCACVLATSGASNKDCKPAVAVVPALIAQIEGIVKDIGTAWGVLKGTPINFAKSKDFQRQVGWKADTLRQGWKYPDWKSIKKDFDLAANLFAEVLFKEMWADKQPTEGTPFLNRHLILHGASFDYGTEANVCRLFMCLDFLESLSIT